MDCADPYLKAREMIVDVDYPTRGTYQAVACPIKLSDSPVAGIYGRAGWISRLSPRNTAKITS